MPDELFPATSAKWLVEQMKNRGIAPKRILADTGLDTSWLEDDNAMLLPDQYCRIVENALDESGDPALGLTISDQPDLNWHGYWGYAVISSSTWRQANQLAIKYWPLNGGLVTLQYREEDNEAITDVLPAFPQLQGRQLKYGIEEFLTLARNAFRFTTGSSDEANEISLSYPAPEYASLYQKQFGGRILFNQTTNQVRSPIEMMNRPIITANPKIVEFCSQQCESMLQNLGRTDSLIEKIRRTLVEMPGRFPGFDDMAEQLEISPRTLNRRLQERKTTYKTIVNEVRSSLAKEYLQKTGLSIDEIASLVGFSETSSFRRFYKKQTGISASNTRKIS